MIHRAGVPEPRHPARVGTDGSIDQRSMRVLELATASVALAAAILLAVVR